MEFVFFILVIAIILRPFTVLFHELGHGITALLLTKEKVTLYIGSYGDPKNSFKFSLGRLEFFIKYFSVLWEIGLCVHQSKNIPLNRQILITLFGPI
ncbi:MAG: hypothetical protein IIA45_12645, partial [Bacteroidetes bacterium]|nr:hypothetical protein [Bacteroidota bacterium]